MPAGPIRGGKGEKVTGKSNHKVGARANESRSHTENQERAYIAASRRTDRSMEARMESARRASELHHKRTGRKLRITEDIVANEEMYEEEDPKYDERARSRGLWMNMNLNPSAYATMPRNSVDYNFTEPLQIFRFSPTTSQAPLTPLTPLTPGTESISSPMQSPMTYMPPNEVQFPTTQTNVSSGVNMQGMFNTNQWQFAKEDLKSPGAMQYSPGAVDMSKVLAQSIFGPSVESRVPWNVAPETANQKQTTDDENPSSGQDSSLSASGEHDLSQFKSIDDFPLDEESLALGNMDDLTSRTDLNDFMLTFTNSDWSNSAN